MSSYTKRFLAQRERRCTICNKTGEPGTIADLDKLSVHHILPSHIYGENNSNHMVVLCNRCHQRIEVSYSSDQVLIKPRLLRCRIREYIEYDQRYYKKSRHQIKDEIINMFKLLNIEFSEVFIYAIYNSSGYKVLMSLIPELSKQYYKVYNNTVIKLKRNYYTERVAA